MENSTATDCYSWCYLSSGWSLNPYHISQWINPFGPTHKKKDKTQSSIFCCCCCDLLSVLLFPRLVRDIGTNFWRGRRGKQCRYNNKSRKYEISGPSKHSLVNVAQSKVAITRPKKYSKKLCNADIVFDLRRNERHDFDCK